MIDPRQTLRVREFSSTRRPHQYRCAFINRISATHVVPRLNAARYSGEKVLPLNRSPAYCTEPLGHGARALAINVWQCLLSLQ